MKKDSFSGYPFCCQEDVVMNNIIFVLIVPPTINLKKSIP